MTLRRHHSPYGRFRVEIRGGEADGAVIDCQTLGAAVRWYRLLTWEPERPEGKEGLGGHAPGQRDQADARQEPHPEH